MTQPQTEQSNAARRASREIRWDAAAAIIASLVGMLALLVAGYTAYIQRQQVSAQVWPYLLGGRSGHEHELLWINKGVGPAIVRNVEVSIDGKPQADWKAVFQTLRFHPTNFFQSTLEENVFSPGEKVDWVQFPDSADYNKFMLVADRLRVKVCYCSTLGDCWIVDSASSGNGTTSVGKCPALPEAQQFHD